MAADGRIWRFGDDIDTDTLAPGRYMAAPIETLAAHCLEAVNPDFAGQVKPGDIIVAGSNFGAGSSREQAADALKQLGIAAIVAKSFAGIFYRNAINLGLPVLECAATDRIPDGATGAVDPATGRLVVNGMDEPMQCVPVPEFLMEIISAGGLVPHLEQRFRRETRA